MTGPRARFLARLAERGYTLAEVAACVVGAIDADPITVDTEHPDYPRTARAACATCGSAEHVTAACPIDPNYDGDYRRDSKGSEGCSCA